MRASCEHREGMLRTTTEVVPWAGTCLEKGHRPATMVVQPNRAQRRSWRSCQIGLRADMIGRLGTAPAPYSCSSFRHRSGEAGTSRARLPRLFRKRSGSGSARTLRTCPELRAGRLHTHQESDLACMCDLHSAVHRRAPCAAMANHSPASQAACGRRGDRGPLGARPPSDLSHRGARGDVPTPTRRWPQGFTRRQKADGASQHCCEGGGDRRALLPVLLFAFLCMSVVIRTH